MVRVLRESNIITEVVQSTLAFELGTTSISGTYEMDVFGSPVMLSREETRLQSYRSMSDAAFAGSCACKYLDAFGDMAGSALPKAISLSHHQR